MFTGIRVLIVALSLAFWLALAHAGELGWYRWQGDPNIPFGGMIDEMPNVRVIPAQNAEDQRIVYGDRFGSVHVLRFIDGRFQEEWVSPSLRSSVSGVFVADINADGRLEIVVYSPVGDIAFFSADKYDEIWRTQEDDYLSISAMTIANVDKDPQLELVFVGKKVLGADNSIVSRLFVYDCLHCLEELRSSQDLQASSIAVGNLDGDNALEIVLNTGPVVDAFSQKVEWHFGGCDKIGYVDIDGDGVPDLIGEFEALKPERFIRVFDIRQNFRAAHGLAASERMGVCASCHGLVTYCAECHSAEGITVSKTFHRDAQGRTHDSDPKGRVMECASCHTPELDYCVTCHEGEGKPTSEIIRAIRTHQKR